MQCFIIILQLWKQLKDLKELNSNTKKDYIYALIFIALFPGKKHQKQNLEKIGITQL